MTDVFEVAETQLREHARAVVQTRELLPELHAVGERLIEVFRTGGRLYTFGNGGSAADAQHLAAELIGRYLRERRPLPAVSLTTDPSVVSCIGNDYSFDEVFARQVRALAREGDMVVGFTTSGRSPNVVRALAEARRAGAVTVLFGGGEQQGMPAAEHADHSLVVPATATARIQEMHLTMLHLLSEQVDAWAAATEVRAAVGHPETAAAPEAAAAVPAGTATAPGTVGPAGTTAAPGTAGSAAPATPAATSDPLEATP